MMPSLSHSENLKLNYIYKCNYVCTIYIIYYMHELGMPVFYQKDIFLKSVIFWFVRRPLDFTLTKCVYKNYI